MTSPISVAWRLGLCVWLAYVATASGTLGTGDAVAVYEQTKAIVDRGALDVPASQSSEAWRRSDGLYGTPFGIGQAVYNIPFLVVGRSIARLAPGLGDADAVPKAAVALGSTVTAALTASFTFLLAWRLSGRRHASLVAALALAFGTLLWPHAKFGFNAALSACALTGGLVGVLAGLESRRMAMLTLGGAGLGLAMLTRHELMLTAIVALIWLGWQARQRPGGGRLMVGPVAAVAIAAVLWMSLNIAQYGHPLFTGHQPAFSAAGLSAFLWSPSGALLLYSPVAIAGVALVGPARRGDAAAHLVIAVVVVQGLFYASLDDWLGTRSYGPRYLVPLLPLCVAPLALIWPPTRMAARVLLAALIVISVAIQMPGVMVSFARAGIAANQPPQTLRRNDWRWAPIWLNVRQAAIDVPANLAYLAGRRLPPAIAPTGALADRVAFSLDFWWLYLHYLGVFPRLVALGIGLGAMVTSAAGIARLLRHERARA